MAQDGTTLPARPQLELGIFQVFFANPPFFPCVHWALADGKGNTVGRLAGAYEQPAGMRCMAASVAAIVRWEREKSEPEFRDLARCERWEVVVPDLVFAPDR